MIEPGEKDRKEWQQKETKKLETNSKNFDLLKLQKKFMILKLKSKNDYSKGKRLEETITEENEGTRNQ